MKISSNKVNLSLQIVPLNEVNAYPIIDEAIAVIQESGVKYQVSPFATLLEGELAELLNIVIAAKEAALNAGAEELLLNIQIHLKKDKSVAFEDKTDKFK